MARPKRKDGRKARTVANNKYNKANYYRIAVNVPRSSRDALQNYAREHGESVNGLINRLIAETIPDFVPLETSNSIAKK